MGVGAPIYFPVGWSVKDAQEHPEWWRRKRDGSPLASNVDAGLPILLIRPEVKAEG